MNDERTKDQACPRRVTALLQTIRSLAAEDKGPNPDSERIHGAVDDALIQYIGIYEVEELIRNMTQWGA